jgi:hypothetical protein
MTQTSLLHPLKAHAADSRTLPSTIHFQRAGRNADRYLVEGLLVHSQHLLGRSGERGSAG